jgi:hypothetical protein
MASDDPATTTAARSESDSVGARGGMRSEEAVAARPLLSPPSPLPTAAAPARESVEELDRRYAPYARWDAYGPMGPSARPRRHVYLSRRSSSSRSGSWRACSCSWPTTSCAACARCGWRRSRRSVARGTGTRGSKGGGGGWWCGVAARSLAQ